MAQLGKIYIAPGGAQLIVTKGGPGVLSDGDVALIRQDSGERFPTVHLPERRRSSWENATSL